MHLSYAFMGAGFSAGAWRMPYLDTAAVDSRAFLENVARLTERGLFDALFIADALVPPDDITQAPPLTPHDPAIMAAIASAVTERVGIIITVSTTYSHPFNLARRLASLDHLSGGRIGFNAVTTASPKAGALFGLDAHVPHDVRYEQQLEMLEVLQELWGSWDPDYHLGDKDAGVFHRPEAIRTVDYQGRHFQVNGMFTVGPSPQGQPVIVQSGASPAGREVAGRTADMVFAAQPDMQESIALRRDIRERAVRHGRDPDTIKIMPGICPVIGGTEAEAKERWAELGSYIPIDSALAFLASRFECDVEDLLPLDEPLSPSLAGKINLETSRSMYEVVTSLSKRRNLTVRELIWALGGRWPHEVLAVTPEQLADQMEEWLKAGACDGFNVLPGAQPRDLEAFVDHVVPELQRRGLHRTEYTGSTLRGHLGVPLPARHEPLRTSS